MVTSQTKLHKNQLLVQPSFLGDAVFWLHVFLAYRSLHHFLVHPCCTALKTLCVLDTLIHQVKILLVDMCPAGLSQIILNSDDALVLMSQHCQTSMSQTKMSPSGINMAPTEPTTWRGAMWGRKASKSFFFFSYFELNSILTHSKSGSNFLSKYRGLQTCSMLMILFYLTDV